MAYNDRRNGGGNRGPYTPPPLPPAAEPKELPEDYVTLAEETVRRLERKGDRFRLTTSKIRSILAMVSEVYNEESIRSARELSPDSVGKLRRVQVRLVYEAGREAAVKDLVTKGELLAYLKGIGQSREAFLRYAGYLEALVAYHRFYGGDN